jgi:hypothetical protein
VFRHPLHSNCRKPFLAATLVVVACTGGCARWNLEDFSLNKLRDDRAVDIDKRLEGTKPIVVNPF